MNSVPAPKQTLSPAPRALAVFSLALGLYLYLGGLTHLRLQRGNEPMYAAPAIWMLETGGYLVPQYEGGPFLQEPPLTWWILAANYKLLGVSVFAARLPSALAALATTLLVGLWVKRRSGEKAGWLSAAARPAVERAPRLVPFHTTLLDPRRSKTRGLSPDALSGGRRPRGGESLP